MASIFKNQNENLAAKNEIVVTNVRPKNVFTISNIGFAFSQKFEILSPLIPKASTKACFNGSTALSFKDCNVSVIPVISPSPSTIAFIISLPISLNTSHFNFTFSEKIEVKSEKIVSQSIFSKSSPILDLISSHGKLSITSNILVIKLLKFCPSLSHSTLSKKVFTAEFNLSFIVSHKPWC